MNKNQITKNWQLFAMPALVILVGLILLFNPDSAIALVTGALAWIFIAFGVIRVIVILTGHEGANPTKWIWPVLALMVGVYFLKNPLVLANVVGRVIGILIFLEGLDDLRKSRHGAAKILAIITMAIGLILFILPRTLTNTVLGICGLVLIVIGVCNLLSKFRDYKALEEGSDPNIIDADE